ncbi:MAG: hypothetical protein QXS85_05270 [Acidilobaceae archaeon]
MSSILSREELEACIDVAYSTYTRSEVLGGSVEVERESSASSETSYGRVALLVKSVHEVSVDEVPILNSIMDALSPRDIDLEIYEYDKLTGLKSSRYEVFAENLEEAVLKGRALIAILPYVMPIALLSRLSREASEVLEEKSSVVLVNVRYKNLLYLPEASVAGGVVELVGKESSLSSTERLQWLREEALRRGFKRVELRVLPDNRSIFEYVTSLGPRGIYKRVPVTKLSYFLVALARCQGWSGIEELMRREEAVHAIYMYGLSKDLENDILSELKKTLSKRSLPVPREPHKAWVKKGVESVMVELLRVYGLIGG